MKHQIIKADSRGTLSLDWLKTYHTFSFGKYQNDKLNNFGVLKALNDSFISPGGTFPEHPHKDMEIITIVLNGVAQDQDKQGNKLTINAGEIQVTSAGTGILHSEFNPSASQVLNLIQIWIFPNKKNLAPSYAKCDFINKLKDMNTWHCFVSSNPGSKELLINQNAYLSLGLFNQSVLNYSYQLRNPGNEVFMMVLDGSIEIEQTILNMNDAIMVEEINSQVNFKVTSLAKLLLIEVTSNLPFLPEEIKDIIRANTPSLAKF